MSRLPERGVEGGRAIAVLVGVDENGLGPRLGPLVVTAVTARATEEGTKLVGRRPRGKLAERLGDSKKLVSFEEGALGEAWARAMARRAGVQASSTEAVVAGLALDEAAVLQQACPSHHVEQCWSGLDEAFGAEEALVAEVESDLARLAERGLEVIGARVAITCAKQLNAAVDRGLSRFHTDLHVMERLVASAARDVGVEVRATCGKVGGFDRYGDAFGSFGLHTAVIEGRARSEYRVPGVGTVAFVRDAEERDLLVAMASLVGKWVRDLFMRRILRYYRASTADLPEASGYHDPVTTRFIAATALARKTARVADECFERRALGMEQKDRKIRSSDDRAPS